MGIPEMHQSALLDRYRSLLEVEPGPPSIDRLERLVRRQIQRVPFENISKLWRFKRHGLKSLVSLLDHLDGIEDRGFGGTCYANNWHFGQLLGHLGYDVAFCGADMSHPDVHTVLIVRLDGREFLVDVGYGAPFFQPVPRDAGRDLEITWGICRYVFRTPDRSGRTRLDLYRSGQLVHGYLAKPQPRSIEYFSEIIADSYRSDAHFMTALVVERFFAGRSVRIHNFKLSEAAPALHRETVLDTREHVVQTVEQHCGIEANTVREAIEDVPLEADIYS
jgi:arylamine N-acetyltransferase